MFDNGSEYNIRFRANGDIEVTSMDAEGDLSDLVLASDTYDMWED